MLLHSIRAEWTKLHTTKSIWLTTILVVLLSAAPAVMVGWGTGYDTGGKVTSTTFSSSVIALIYVAFLVIIVQSIMIYTTEFRFGYQQQSYLATPKRWVVMVAKWLLYAVIAALLTFITVILCFYLVKITAGDSLVSGAKVWSNPVAQKIMWQYPLAATLLVTFSAGIAMLIRHTAGAVTLMLMWYLALENVLTIVSPRKIADFVSKYGPITNLQNFLLHYRGGPDPGWSVDMGIVYFGVWAAVFFILGIIVVERRDA